MQFIGWRRLARQPLYSQRDIQTKHPLACSGPSARAPKHPLVQARHPLAYLLARPPHRKWLHPSSPPASSKQASGGGSAILGMNTRVQDSISMSTPTVRGMDTVKRTARAERNDIHPQLLHILPARPHEAARGRHPGTDPFAYLARALACLGQAFGLTLKLAETDRSLHPPRLSLSRKVPPPDWEASSREKLPGFPREVAARGRGVDNRGCEGEEDQLCVWSIWGVEREGVISLNAERRIPRSKARVYGREKPSMADEKSGRRRAATTTEEDEPTPLCPDQVPQPSLR